MNHALTKKHLVLFLMLSLPGLASAFNANRLQPRDSIIYLRVKLQSSAAAKVKVAALKFNKHVAFSFTVDDGYRSAYSCAFPLLSGGTVSAPIPDEYKNDSGGDGQYSPGLFFSDGCGQKIPFKLAVAINAGIVYDHPANRSRLSWPEVTALYQSGWDLLNHGYHHLTRHGTDFNNEVIQNIDTIKQKLGFTMSQFVVPGGPSDPGYEHDYERDAFKSGAFAVASYVGAGPVIDVNHPVKLNGMIYARELLQSNGDTVNLKTVDKHLQKIDSLMRLPSPTWYNAFTHNVGNGNLWGISMIYPEFKYYMTTIAARYGSKGTDRIWMAPWQEVYEYVWLRDRVKVTTRQEGKNLLIQLNIPKIPDVFRHKDITLALQTDGVFTVVSANPNTTETDNGKKQHSLINIKIN